MLKFIFFLEKALEKLLKPGTQIVLILKKVIRQVKGRLWVFVPCCAVSGAVTKLLWWLIIDWFPLVP